MGAIKKKIAGQYNWENTELVTYDNPTVKGVSKRVLIGRREHAPNFAMRYFEVQSGGNSALESHPEVHEVFILRGKGKVLMGEDFHEISEGDVVYIAPNERHEFMATSNGPLGFICVAAVSAEKPDGA